MATFAAVMTGKGTGAIATIQLYGDGAAAEIAEIFKPAASRPPRLETGSILLGTIIDGDKTIDQVTIGCEAPATFAINCHGNPLIVEMIMELLQRRGLTLCGAEELLTRILSADESLNTIAVESRLAQLRAKTLEGTRILAAQIDSGLTKKLNDWLARLDVVPLSDITTDAARILADSQTAKLIISGCTAVLTGPPNTGKSTLLNCLARRQKAIVTDIGGTTRDWVSAECRIGPLSLELIDTAGLDDRLAAAPDTVEKAAQHKSAQMLERADLILLVLDAALPAARLDTLPLERIAAAKILTILNKSDMPARLHPSDLPPALADAVAISAKFETGIDGLRSRILQVTGAAAFDLDTPVCFTSRQQNLLETLTLATSKNHARKTITDLLSARLIA
jgi:tRNA modification GTPase